MQSSSMATICAYYLGTIAQQRALQDNYGQYSNILHKRTALGRFGQPFRSSYTLWIKNIPA